MWQLYISMVAGLLSMTWANSASAQSTDAGEPTASPDSCRDLRTSCAECSVQYYALDTMVRNVGMLNAGEELLGRRARAWPPVSTCESLLASVTSGELMFGPTHQDVWSLCAEGLEFLGQLQGYSSKRAAPDGGRGAGLLGSQKQNGADERGTPVSIPRGASALFFDADGLGRAQGLAGLGTQGIGSGRAGYGTGGAKVEGVTVDGRAAGGGRAVRSPALGTLQWAEDANLYVMEHELTQAQWSAVMGSNPSRFTGCDHCPVEMVSWDDAIAFAEEVSRQEGWKYRLLTVQEWEAAARASESHKFSGSNKAHDVGWTWVNSGYKTHTVCKKQRNAYGLCDMTGNVREWTTTRDGTARAKRGSAFCLGPLGTRIDPRNWFKPGRHHTVGLRLARDP